MLELLIKNGETIYKPVVEDGITWETERYGSPGKLTFSVVNDSNSPTSTIPLNIQEGNLVTLSVDGVNVFYGFIFTKSRDRDQIITVTVYDQLRYLKNKDTYNYTDWTTADLIRKIAADFFLKCGNLVDTGYAISAVHDGDTLFDMILYNMQETTRLTGKGFVFFDDFGKLTLKNMESMKLDYLLTEKTAENFKYTSSIDGETYNKIKLVYDNEDTNLKDVYITQDSNSIQNWGVLQYFEKINKQDSGILKAEALLSMYNSKRRTLTISKAFGDVRVRGGSLIPVILALGDVNARSYLLVDKVKHTFSENYHTMDLTLRGNILV